MAVSILRPGDVFDGRTGEQFDRKVTVGYIYMLKPIISWTDRSRAFVGPYSLVTSSRWAARRSSRPALRRNGGLGGRSLRRPLHAARC